MNESTTRSRRSVLRSAGVAGAVLSGAVGLTAANGGGHKSENRKINELREATAKYHDIEKAKADGYRPTNHCVSHPDPKVGAMGYHYVNPALIDGDLGPTKPEVLVYEERGGERHLVACEFLSTVSERPSLFGQEFHEFHLPLANWELHVWAWKDNPQGLFANFNPRVDCP